MKAAALALLLVLGLSACAQPEATPIPAPSASQSQPDELARYYGQSIEWRNCGDADCARIDVPVDYAKPNGETLELSLTRVKATGERIGSLFLNPGGPGGSAFDYARAAENVLNEDVRASYDIVGVDPRGVGGSTPIECLTDAERDVLVAVDGTPSSAMDVQEIEAASGLPREGCEANAPQLIRAVSTTTAARDLDVVRAVLGDPVLNYLGKSYGTYLGAVYAELFPSRVGRMVLDGVLAPDRDLIGRSEGQAAAFEDQVTDFARDCSTRDDCPFAGDAEQVLEELQTWLRNLEASPLKAKGRTLSEGNATYAVISYLYFPSIDYPALRDGLNEAVKGKDPERLLEMLDARTSRGPDGRYTDNGTDAFYAVTCLDSPYAGTVEETQELANTWGDRYPTFGTSLAWGLLACAQWPKANEAPISEITAKGSAPILVIGNEHDPATPGQWAKDLASTLDNSRLLFWNGRNHTAYREGSECIDTVVDDYLVQGTLPEADVICQ